MDIDIDFLNRDDALAVLKHVRASRLDSDKLVPHNSGIYLHNIPHNPITNLSTIDYKTAEQRGYFKIDFLNVQVYKGITTEDELYTLMDTKPEWTLLEAAEITNQLFHINGYGDILRQMKPKSVEQLAAVLAIIRPAKRYLIGKDWNTVLTQVWIKPAGDEYYFKKSHAISYSMAIIVQLNKLCETLQSTSSEL